LPQESLKVVRSKKRGARSRLKPEKASTLTLLEYRLQPASVSFYDFEILLRIAEGLAKRPALRLGYRKGAARWVVVQQIVAA
jgi:hypothetical protein